jgi:hypothetical protein
MNGPEPTAFLSFSKVSTSLAPDVLPDVLGEDRDGDPQHGRAGLLGDHHQGGVVGGGDRLDVVGVGVVGLLERSLHDAVEGVGGVAGRERLAVGLTPWRILKVQVSPSWETCQDSASSGTGAKFV